MNLTPAALLLLGSIWPTNDPPWSRVEAARFTVYGQTPVRELSRVAQELEGLCRAHDTLLADQVLTSERTTWVFVFPDSATMAPFLGDLSDVRQRVGGIFRPSYDANFAIIDASMDDDPTPLLFHEWTHAFTSAHLREIPTWLHEGLAEYFSTVRVQGNRALIGTPPSGALRILDVGRAMDWREVWAWSTDPLAIHRLNDGDAELFYAQAWLLTHYLLRGPEHSAERWRRFVSLLRAGADTDAALTAAYEIEAYTLADRLEVHRSRLRGPIEVALTGSAKALPAPTVTSSAEIHARLGDLLLHSGASEDSPAESLLVHAAALDSTFADGRVALGTLHLFQGREDAAESEARAALRRSPGSARAWSLLGNALLVQAARQEDWGAPLPSTPPVLLEAREAFHRSLALAPDWTDAQFGLAQTFLHDRGENWEGIRAISAFLEERPHRIDALELLIVLTANSGALEAAWQRCDASRITLLDPEQTARIECHLLAEELRASIGRQASASAFGRRLDELEGRVFSRDGRALLARLRADPAPFKTSSAEPPAAR
ncbi:MAG: hypothetical protein IT349_20710 [Candidatus Eisenbacteria bacterium]|nr:hypothetical protein [Candidatus Eisenbacteria bacterium]